MFHGVKVFSASTGPDRASLGARVTRWLRESGPLRVTDRAVLQSSNERGHCLSVVLFYQTPEAVDL